jgi:RNA polymerase sigma factor (TIGR02999 family)
MSELAKTTELVMDAAAGSAAAANQLLPLVYDDLHSLAERLMRREPATVSLQATALIHESYLRLVDQTRVDWKGKTHYFAISATMMRRILVDHARKKATLRRGGARLTLTLDPELAASDVDEDIDLLALDEALSELAELNEREAQVVELRFFGGLSGEETAHVLGISERSVKRDWRVAKAWLGQRLG